MDFRRPVAFDNGRTYSPSITGGGTHTNQHFQYWRIGEFLKVVGAGVSGTPTGVVVKIPVPTGLTINSSRLGTINASKIVGTFHGNVTTTATSFPVASRGNWVVTYDANEGTNVVTIASASDLSGEESNSIFINDTDTNIFGTSRGYSLEFMVPITEWAL